MAADGVVGHAGDDEVPVLCHLRQVVALALPNRARVEQVVVLRVLFKNLLDGLPGLFPLAVVGQRLGFDQLQLDGVV
ncbi:hypothetical protein, partial [Pseudomonas aeruginosa]